MLNLKTGVLSLMCALVIGTVSARCPSWNRGNTSYPYGQGYSDYGYDDHGYNGGYQGDMNHNHGYIDYGYDHHDNRGWDQGHMNHGYYGQTNQGYMSDDHYADFRGGNNYGYDQSYDYNQRNTNANDWRSPEQEAQIRAAAMQRDPMSNNSDWTNSVNANKAANAANAAASQVAK